MMLQQIANDEPHNDSEHHRHPIDIALFFEFSNPALIKVLFFLLQQIQAADLFFVNPLHVLRALLFKFLQIFNLLPQIIDLLLIAWFQLPHYRIHQLRARVLGLFNSMVVRIIQELAKFVPITKIPRSCMIRCVCFSEIELLKMFSTAAGE